MKSPGVSVISKGTSVGGTGVNVGLREVGGTGVNVGLRSVGEIGVAVRSKAVKEVLQARMTSRVKLAKTSLVVFSGFMGSPCFNKRV